MDWEVHWPDAAGPQVAASVPILLTKPVTPSALPGEKKIHTHKVFEFAKISKEFKSAATYLTLEVLRY